MITKDELIKFGMVENTGEDKVLYPYIKSITGKEFGQDNGIYIVVTNEYNISEFCLILPDGNQLFLNIDSIDELIAFEKYIDRWEPGY